MSENFSFSIVIAFKDDKRILDCIKSFIDCLDFQFAELLLVAGSTDSPLLEEIRRIIEVHSNIRLIPSPETSRQFRRDLGAEIAKSENICFIDSDCKFDREYCRKLLPFAGKYKIIRAPVVYIPRNSYFSRGSCNYREIADNYLFKEETFSPNLVINRQVLLEAGGWQNRGLTSHFSDDFVLSDNIRALGYVVKHVEGPVVFHHDDDNPYKTLKTWFGYGTGWAFRYYASKKKRATSILSYIPPFPFRREYGLSYLFMALLHWITITSGYFYGLITLRKS